MSNIEPTTYGFELPLLLFGGFRSIIDELHAELARLGHPDLRPAHGFALQAIGPRGATATEAGRRTCLESGAALFLEKLRERMPLEEEPALEGARRNVDLARDLAQRAKPAVRLGQELAHRAHQSPT